MPALKGSLTYTRFFVEGEVQDDFRERFMKNVRHRAMRPLAPDDEELERSGWAKLGEPMTTDLGGDDVFWESSGRRADSTSTLERGFVVLSFRTDKWQLPANVLKSRLKEAESAYLEKKGRTRLSRSEKTELKALVAKKLRRTTDPATRAVDLVWALDEGVVRFFSHAPKPGAVMSELFAKSFGVKLVPESPYTAAARIGLDEAEQAAWAELEATYLGEAPLGREIDDAAAEEE